MSTPDRETGNQFGRGPGHGADHEPEKTSHGGAAREPGQKTGPVPEPISERGQAFLDELTAFVEFLQGLWGILAGISVFFPLSNVFFAVIPMHSLAQDGAFHLIPTGLVTALATLLTLFVLLSTFTHRKALTDVNRKAWTSLVAGVLVLIGYLILHEVKMNIFDIWGVESGHPFHLAFEIPMMLLYAMFFALTSRAFVLLGLLEFYRRP